MKYINSEILFRPVILLKVISIACHCPNDDFSFLFSDVNSRKHIQMSLILDYLIPPKDNILIKLYFLKFSEHPKIR